MPSGLWSVFSRTNSCVRHSLADPLADAFVLTYLKTPHSFPCHGLSQTQSAAELLHRPFKLQSRSEVQVDAIDADVQMDTAESSSRACINRKVVYVN